jgi:hypothetical protein
MLRLGISRVEDWTGSAVDFVATGLGRLCRANGLAKVSRVFPESSIRLMDEIVELSEYERQQSETVGPSPKMFLMVDYFQSAVIQIGPTLSFLASIHNKLPAAFFVALAHNLWRWMRVYDFRDAEAYATDAMSTLDEDEIKESFFPNVAQARPRCLDKLPTYQAAIKLLQRVLPTLQDKRAAGLLSHCLAMHNEGDGHELAWPHDLLKQLPEMEAYLENTDEPGPGSLIVFEEEDLIEACFSEEMQYLGQNYSIRSTWILLIDVAQPPTSLDEQVKAAFDYLAAMLRSLTSASVLIETIRGIYDEYLRQGRREPGVHAEPSAAGLR